jgi:putative flippase GtrA
MMPPLLAQDKANHDFYGSLIAAVCVVISLLLYLLVLLFGHRLPATPQRLAAIAQAVVIAFAAWKEWVYDAAHPDVHTVDVRDFYATCIGGLKVVGPLFLTGALL